VKMSVSELDGPVTLVRLDGKLDAPGAEQIGVQFTAAVAARGRNAIVDLSEVGFIASMGLRLLISTARALSLKGGSLVLFGATPMVQGVFDDAALDQIIPSVATEDEAIAQFVS